MVIKPYNDHTSKTQLSLCPLITVENYVHKPPNCEIYWVACEMTAIGRFAACRKNSKSLIPLFRCATLNN